MLDLFKICLNMHYSNLLTKNLEKSILLLKGKKTIL